eukprot:scaffold94830_cov32-Tisochrysis_lutea.AAC.1
MQPIVKSHETTAAHCWKRSSPPAHATPLLAHIFNVRHLTATVDAMLALPKRTVRWSVGSEIPSLDLLRTTLTACGMGMR